MKIETTLGIMSIPRNSPMPFSPGQSEAFIEIISFAKKVNCLAYVMSPFEINWATNETWGYQYNETDHCWVKSLFPLPDVIYNRIPNRRLENREDIQQNVSLIIDKYGTRFFNPCFLDKWTVHQVLAKDPRTKYFVPETKILKSPADIGELLLRHRSIYIKPSSDSLGNRMYKVEMKKKRIKFTHQSIGVPTENGYVQTIYQLFDLIIGLQNDNFIVQQAVDLANYNGRPFDLRFLVQKDNYGLWKTTGVAARIAGETSISTHLFYGGTKVPAEKAIHHAAKQFGFIAERVFAQIKDLYKAVPEIIEKLYNRSFGELEMDIGIDKEGHVWLFEANSKPFKFDEQMIRAKSLTRLLGYVKHLAANNDIPN